MGISDEDYANAIEHLRVHQLAAKNLGAVSGTLTLGTDNAGTGTWATNIQQPYGTFKVLTEEDLHNQAMKAPLSALVDMWLARWQGEWVNESEFQEDDFWRIAMIRLTGANKLEKHNLANQYQAVYRIIE
jgi:hypothetical protein